MKNSILAAAAVLALTLSVAPSFAASQQSNTQNGDGYSNNCASILANHDGHSRSEVQSCEAGQ